MAEEEGERRGGQRRRRHPQMDGVSTNFVAISCFDEGTQTPAVTLLFELGSYEIIIAGNKLVVRAPSGSVRELGV